MRVLPPRAARTVAALCLLVGTLISPVAADDTLDQQVAEASEALTSASKAVEAAARSLKDAQKRLPAARAKMAAALTKEAEAKAIYVVAKTDLARAKARYATAANKLASKQAEIQQLQKRVNEFARSIYQQGPTSQWAIILESQSPSDLTSRLETIKAVSEASSADLNDLIVAKTDLKAIADGAAEVKAEMQTLADQATAAYETASAAADAAAAAKAEVDKLVAQESDALAVAEKDRQEVKKQYEELRAEQIRIAGTSGSGSSGNGDPEATGPLDWPVSGYSSSWRIGWRVHPKYGYRSCHTGIDISAPSGTLIRAAGTGVVLDTFWSRPYGRVTLVDHGGGLVTMYAHQSAWLVSKGDVVVSGEGIGKVGSTGFSTGSHLHFEVHVNGVPYNPRGWFGGDKSVVSCWNKV